MGFAILKDGDGDDYDIETHNVIISTCDNGYLVTVQDDEKDSVMVFEYNNGKQMINYLTQILGVK